LCGIWYPVLILPNISLQHNLISSDFDVSLFFSSAVETILILEIPVRSYSHKEADHGERAKISKNWL